MNWKHAIRQNLVLASLVMLSAGTLVAQADGPGHWRATNPEEQLEMHLGFLDDKLDLTEEQSDAVRSVLEDAHAEAAVWRKEHPEATREEKRAFRKEHREATNAAILEVLNDDQKTAFDDLKDFRGPRGRGMHGRHGERDMAFRHMHRRAHRAGPPQGAMMDVLDLTPAQEESLREILTEEQNAKLDQFLDRRARGFHRRGRHGDGPGMMLGQLDLSDDQKEQLKSLRESHRAAAKAWHDANPDATREDRQAFRQTHREGMKAMLNSVLTEEQIQKLDSLKSK